MGKIFQRENSYLTDDASAVIITLGNVTELLQSMNEMCNRFYVYDRTATKASADRGAGLNPRG